MPSEATARALAAASALAEGALGRGLSELESTLEAPLPEGREGLTEHALALEDVLQAALRRRPKDRLLEPEFPEAYALERRLLHATRRLHERLDAAYAALLGGTR